MKRDLDAPDLGPCCHCGGTERVRNIIGLAKKAPAPGTGWGCFVCGLPADGALAVLCDACVKRGLRPRYAFKGYPQDGERVPVETLVGRHTHDAIRHTEPRAAVAPALASRN